MDVKYNINDKAKLKIDNLFYEFNKDGKPIIAYIGRMTSKKGIWKILQLSKYINKSNLDLKILIAGPCDDNYLKKITKFINKNKIHNIKLIPQGI